MSHEEYIPGVCNIGGAEVRLRRLVGWAGLICTIALWGCLVWAKASPLVRLWVGGPALMAALGFLQARRGFCVNYGLGGVSSFGEGNRKPKAVEDEESRGLDRRTSVGIIVTSLVVAEAVAIAAYFFPPRP